MNDMGAIATSSIKENHRDEKDGKSELVQQTKGQGKQETIKAKQGFSFLGKKSKVEEIKKKLGPTGVLPPITADRILEAAQTEIMERYPIREPVIYVSVARDEMALPFT
jgi:hypothetical protein